MGNDRCPTPNGPHRRILTQTRADASSHTVTTYHGVSKYFQKLILRRIMDNGLEGRGPYRNKYFAGTLPWHRSLRDVNLCNGNLFKSFTDIQVAPAKGAGLAMQRTYNSMDDRIGPFGQGWTHAYDIRTEEENPDTGYIDDSLNYMDRSDFFAGKHKYHRDADGLYSPPPYLFDEADPSYDKFLVNGPVKVLDDTESGCGMIAFLNNGIRAGPSDSDLPPGTGNYHWRWSTVQAASSI